MAVAADDEVASELVNAYLRVLLTVHKNKFCINVWQKMCLFMLKIIRTKTKGYRIANIQLIHKVISVIVDGWWLLYTKTFI